ncbi:MAG: GNAT family N-acetyltransferase [Flavobacterium sp.]
MNILIETDRLILRPIVPSDVEAMFVLDSNPNVNFYLGNNPVKTIEESQAIIEMIRSQYIQNGIGRFAVVLKETNEFIGWCGIKFITEPENNHVNFYEIGYRFQENHWGKGYGFESAKAWMDYAFSTMKVKAMYASAHIDNTGSNKILQKIGLKQNGQYLHDNIPCYWYELENESIF